VERDYFQHSLLADDVRPDSYLVTWATPFECHKSREQLQSLAPIHQHFSIDYLPQFSSLRDLPAILPRRFS
jgi:hypothetical protein